MATKANLFIDQGATYETVLTLTDEDGEILDLTSSNATSQIYHRNQRISRRDHYVSDG
jgi:hypothetical protein